MTDSLHIRILLVEDDEKLGHQVCKYLQAGGFEVSWIQHGHEALVADPSQFQLLVLDIMLPGTSGLDLLKHYRSQGCNVPVLMLSARDSAAIKVRALDLGADDYLTKPFWPEELLARVHARLRRPLAQEDGVIELGTLKVEPGARRASVADEDLDLTRAEFDLLLALALRPGTAIERGWLAEHVLNPENEGTGRTLDVHVSRLRKKLGSLSGSLETVWGVGYRLEVSA